MKSMIRKILEEGEAENDVVNTDKPIDKNKGKNNEQDLQKTIRLNKVHCKRSRVILLKEFNHMLKMKNQLVLAQTMPISLKR